MLGIGDVRDYIAGLGIADNNNVYCGKLDNKKDKSIGVYNLNRQRPLQTAVGGLNNSSYRTIYIQSDISSKCCFGFK